MARARLGRVRDNTKVEFTTKHWDALLDGYPGLIDKARPRALNKVGVQALNASIKKMLKRYNLPKRRLKKGLRISQKATKAKPVIILSAEERKRQGFSGTDRPGLINYRGTTQTVRIKGRVRKLTAKRTTFLSAKKKGRGSGGVKVQIIKRRKKLIRGAFIAFSFGAVNVFKRTDNNTVPEKGSYAGRVVTRGPNRGQKLKRETIESQVGPSIPSMFKRKGRGAARQYVRKNLGRILNNQIQHLRRQMKTA